MLRKIRGIINSLFYKTQRLRNDKSISVPHDFKAKTEFTLSLFLFFACCICLFELKDKNIVFDSEVTNFFDDDNPQNVSDYKSMIEDVIKCLKNQIHHMAMQILLKFHLFLKGKSIIIIY